MVGMVVGVEAWCGAVNQFVAKDAPSRQSLPAERSGLKRPSEGAQRFHGALVLAAVEEASCDAAMGVAIASLPE